MDPNQACAELETLARQLLPATSHFAVASLALEPPALWPAEIASASGMAPLRRREFAAGRGCARSALAALDLAPCPIPVGPGRAPIWPAGITGSISHTRELAAAALGRLSSLRSLGIDLEPAAPLEPELLPHVLTAAERATLGDGAEALLRAKISFSAKESVYKCLFPVTGRFLEFHHVRLIFDRRWTEFRLDPAAPASPEVPTTGVRGRAGRAASHIMTVAWLEPPSGSRAAG